MIDLTISEALQKLKSREISATELTRAHLDRIEQLNPELNAYITVTAERALADAAAADARYADGTARILDGIPIGMKDLFATRGIRSTAGSKMLENFIPEYESTVSQNLINMGTVLLGKTNMDEFAMSGTGRTSYFGPSVNPYSRDVKLMPGGSSSGSVAAVAAGLCMAATGSDTGDSIRFPSSLTGLVGMKPTYGLCSRYGCFAYASSLDHPGSIARTVDDAAILLGAMAGCDAHDSTSFPGADAVAEKLRAGITPADVRGLRIGIIRETMDAPGIADDVRAMFDRYVHDLAAMGAEIVELSVPHVMLTGTLYGVISRAEAASNLARYDGMKYGLRVDGADLNDTYRKTRAAGFGDNVKHRMLTGAITQTADFYTPCFVQAAKVRRLLANEFDAAMEKCDVILSPAAPTAAFPLTDDLNADAARVSNAMLVPMNMLGMPGCSVPAARNAAGLPMGLHIAGAFGDDVQVLSVAKVIEGMAALDNRPTIVMGK
ncbi:Asp-tRNA(Asn)/Glu-tRNA(Gln) amidotransferase subunit GatA [bacterium]|nr:Asp-tRNA(Asn)/Glu-tRNA(Gln) amidotransferase subunit GatA [bacterium]